MALTKLPGFTLDSTSSFTFANANVTANVSAGNILTNNLLYANGTAWTFGGTPGGSNTYVQFNDAGTFGGANTFVFDKFSNTLTVNNITTGGGSGGNISGVDYLTANYIAGTLTTNAQPNITSVGTLASLTVTGLVTATAGGIKVGNLQDPTGTNTIALSSGNVSITGNIVAGSGGTGNVTATYFIGNGSQLTGLAATYSNTNVAAYLPTYTGNVSANYFIGNGSTLTSITGANVTGYVSLSTTANTAATVTTAAQPNITSLGTLVDANISGNLLVAGNLTVNGTTAYTNVTNLYVKDPIIEMGGGANNAPLTTNDGKDRGTLLHYYTTAPVDAFMGWDNSNGEFSFGSNVTISSEVVTFNSFGNVRAGNFIGTHYGNGYNLSGLLGSNVLGQVGNALVAGTVYTAAQPNITSVGTLASLSVTGNLSAGNVITSGTGGNISDANWIIANYFSGNGSALSSITGSNVVGQVGNALVAGTVYTAAQPNITSVGTLASLSVTGNISTAGNVVGTHYGNGYNLSGLFGSNVLGQVGNALVASTVYTAAQPNITSVGTLSSVSITGNVSSGGNIIGNGQYLTSITGANVNGAVSYATTANSVAGGNVSGQVGNALIAGTVYTNAQPNITSVGTLTSLSVTGNLTAGNINGGNAIVGNYFVGDGSLLTGLPASYSNTNVASYLPTYTGNFSPSNLVVSTSANLGAVGNITITGGSANYVLTTNGSGVLSWAAQTGGGGGSTSTTISVDNFTGNGVADTFTLSVTPTSVNSVFVNYNGAFVGRGSYSLSGANLTFGSIPANGSNIEVTTIEGLTIGSGAFTTRTATGDNSTVNYTVTSGATVSSVLVTLDGVLQTPTSDYTISGSTLTFTTAPASGVAIQIRELSVASSSGGGASNTSIRAQAMTMGIIFGG